MEDLLYLVHRIPYPPNKGDKIRSYHILKYLSQHFRVHLGCFIDDANDRQYIHRLKGLCASTCFIEQSPFKARLLSLQGLFLGSALSLSYYRNAALQTWIQQLLATGKIDRALVFSGPMAQYLHPLPAPMYRVIDFVDVDSEKWRQFADTKAWPLSLLYRREAQHLLDYECAVAQQFDCATFVSSAEAALFKKRALAAPVESSRIEFFNNGVDAEFFSPLRLYTNPYPRASSVVVFTGAMDYWPNIEAVRWFATAIMPSLLIKFPSLHFFIVGARPTKAVRALAQLPGVFVTGQVADMRPYLAHAALAVAPMKIARGIQNKVLEAMAMAKTVIASPQALEGISARPGSEVLLAVNEAEFISVLTRLLPSIGNKKADRSIGQAARKRVLQDYCWDKNLARLGTLLGLPEPERTGSHKPAENAGSPAPEHKT